MLSKASASQKANVIDIGSSGSIGLVFQAILPFILFSGRASNRPFSISIHGGTNVSWSPSYDYIDQVLLPTLSTLGLPPVTATLHQRGWLRGDRGLVTFKITPVPRGQKLQPFRFEKRSMIQRITATILTPPSWQGQAERELSEALRAGFPDLDESAFIINFEKSPQKSLYLLLVATSSNGDKLGRDWLYNEKITAVPVALSRMVKRVTAELASEVRHGGCVDEHMRDQLVVFQALADGCSFVDGGRDAQGNMVAPSLHARTAEWVVEKILDTVCIEAKGWEFDDFGRRHQKGTGEQARRCPTGLHRVTDAG
ncbi:MFS allantoate transporter [Neofusicoccum parvum]|uniref:MFS allantoate transporter n=1 Tax=Neofusicoccum parvum TaxID=310453 RepID=A0ACB5SJ89_9PEZI|nr:MFS allantoate transporter [Neofusicoccum parvum]GME64139.1 MFS allantoate transporter [Neofusicoccum parvum]